MRGLRGERAGGADKRSDDDVAGSDFHGKSRRAHGGGGGGAAGHGCGDELNRASWAGVQERRTVRGDDGPLSGGRGGGHGGNGDCSAVADGNVVDGDEAGVRAVAGGVEAFDRDGGSTVVRSDDGTVHVEIARVARVAVGSHIHAAGESRTADHDAAVDGEVVIRGQDDVAVGGRNVPCHN